MTTTFNFRFIKIIIIKKEKPQLEYHLTSFRGGIDTFVKSQEFLHQMRVVNTIIVHAFKAKSSTSQIRNKRKKCKKYKIIRPSQDTLRLS